MLLLIFLYAILLSYKIFWPFLVIIPWEIFAYVYWRKNFPKEVTE